MGPVILAEEKAFQSLAKDGPVVGQGRIAVWEGAALWMIEGEQTADLYEHAHHAIQITFRLKGWFEIDVTGNRLAGPVAAVGPDTSHSFRASGAVAFLFIAPESAIGIALRDSLFADKPWTEIADGPLAASLDMLRSSLEGAAAGPDLRRLGQTILDEVQPAAPTKLADPRVITMIDHIRQNLDTRVSLAAAAGSIGLSPSRARHLFVAQTGLPFKAYVLWLRIELAVALYAAGSSLTEAAHEAGFADSAHFNRTFRKTFGLAAAGLRLQQG